MFRQCPQNYILFGRMPSSHILENYEALNEKFTKTYNCEPALNTGLIPRGNTVYSNIYNFTLYKARHRLLPRILS